MNFRIDSPPRPMLSCSWKHRDIQSQLGGVIRRGGEEPVDRAAYGLGGAGAAPVGGALGGRGGYQVVEAWQEPLPALGPLWPGMIVLGGSPNVDEEEQFPYLRPFEGGHPGDHRGGQGLPGILPGAPVAGPRAGVPGRAAAAKIRGVHHRRIDPGRPGASRLSGLAVAAHLFKWHGQGVLPPLPAGVEILARSAAAPVEALGLAGNPRVVGVQFDNHAAARGRGQVAEARRRLGPERLGGRPRSHHRHAPWPRRRTWAGSSAVSWQIFSG